MRVPAAAAFTRMGAYMLILVAMTFFLGIETQGIAVASPFTSLVILFYSFHCRYCPQVQSGFSVLSDPRK